MQVTYSVTYDIVTPESAENGNFAETGFEIEDSPLEIDADADLIQTAADLVADVCGHVEASSSGPLDSTDWFTSADPEIDYSDASEYRRSVHFSGLTDAQMQALAAELTARGLY